MSDIHAQFLNVFLTNIEKLCRIGNQIENTLSWINCCPDPLYNFVLTTKQLLLNFKSNLHLYIVSSILQLIFHINMEFQTFAYNYYNTFKMLAFIYIFVSPMCYIMSGVNSVCYLLISFEDE